jgi:hypothetical protein
VAVGTAELAPCRYCTAPAAFAHPTGPGHVAIADFCVAKVFVAIYTGLHLDTLPGFIVTGLTKIAGWDGGARVNIVFVHGLGGHASDTWRRNGDATTFWPAWLARDIPGLAAWTLAYDAPPSNNWFGAGMALQDRATNVLECLARPA